MKTDYAKGMAVMTASSLFFSVMSLLVPLARPAATELVSAARFVIGIVMIAGFAVSGLTRLSPRNWLWLAVRGIIGAASVYLFFRGIAVLGLGKGTVLNYTYPVFAALFSPLLLREKLHLDVLAAIVVSFVGIYLVFNPANILDIGVDGLLALLGGVLSGVAVVAIKKLRETDSPSSIYLAQCVFGLLVVGYPAAAGRLAFAPVTWIVLAALGVVATVAQLMMTWAYKHVPATEGSLLAFLTPVINVLLGVLLFGEAMRPATIAGCLLVFAACAWVAFRQKILRVVR